MIGKFRFKKAELGYFNSSAKKVADVIDPGCRLIGLTNGEFSLIDLLYYILAKIGGGDVVICTWSAGIKDAHNVEWMRNEDLMRSVLLITDHSYVTRQPRYVVSIDKLFGTENIRTAEVHAKFVLISNDDWNIVIRTSMNLNANKTCESFEIDDDVDIFDFYKRYTEDVTDNMPEGFIGDTKTARNQMASFFAVEDSAFGSHKIWSES